jgi:hypothetical protein
MFESNWEYVTTMILGDLGLLGRPISYVGSLL